MGMVKTYDYMSHETEWRGSRGRREWDREKINKSNFVLKVL